MTLFNKIKVFCFVGLLFLGCRKSTNANWDVDAAIPVVNSVLNVTNFLSDTLFDVDNTGLLHVVLNREVAAIKLDSLLKLPDTTLIAKFVSPSPFPLKLGPGQPIPGLVPAELPFDIGDGVKLKLVEIRKGFLNVKFSNDISQPMDLVYKLPTATKNGVPFTISETVPTGTNSLVKTYDLSGYTINMRGLSGHAYNVVPQTYTVLLNPKADTAEVLYNQGAYMELSYTDLTPEYVEGYFGQQTIDLDLDTARFDFNKNFKASNFMLSEATMDFSILNEFGAEFNGSLSNIKSINTLDNKAVALNTNQLSNININRATKAGKTIYPSVKSFQFNTNNSNVTSFISNLPDKLTYQGKVSVNPLGNISGYNDFAFYNTGLRIIANIDIPLKYTADYFELTTNAEVDFSNVSQLDHTNYGSFVVFASNGFPFTARLQAYMYDERDLVLDSLFLVGANTIDGGSVNSNNEVITPTQKRLVIPITPGKIGSLKKCKNIRVVSRFIMPSNPPAIKILEKYEMKIKVVAELNYNVRLGS